LDGSGCLLGQDGRNIAGVIHCLVDGIRAEAQDGQANRGHSSGNESRRDPDQGVDGALVTPPRHICTGCEQRSASGKGCCFRRAKIMCTNDPIYN
jgi:hypothetical protein